MTVPTAMPRRWRSAEIGTLLAQRVADEPDHADIEQQGHPVDDPEQHVLATRPVRARWEKDQ